MPDTSSAEKCVVCCGTEIEDFCTARDRVRRQEARTWQIKRCRRCGFGWTFPLPAAEQLGSLYPLSYLGDTQKTLDEFHSGNLQRSRSWRGEIEKVRLVEELRSGGKILDVGCGDGKFLWALEASRWDRTGVDHSRETIQLVKRCLPGLEMIAGDIDSPSLATDSFDVVTFWHVLEHLLEPRHVLARAASLLKQNGWLIVSLPNLDSLQAALFKSHWYAFDDVPRHIHHFSRDSLDRLLRESGLQPVRHLLFSRFVNFHALKHSLLNWSGSRFGTPIPYYLLKPLLFAFPLIERLTGRFGILTVIAHKPQYGASPPI